MTIVASNSLTLSNVNDGTITHYAYAYSADGTDRFTTVYPNLNLLKGTKTSKSITGNNTVNQGGLLYSFDNNSTLNNQGFSVNDTITLEFDWSATNPASGTFILQWQGTPWGFYVPTTTLSSTNGSGHIKYTFNIRAADIASTAVATGIGYRFDNIPTNTIITFSNVIISKAKTADWPKYIGHYTDFMQADSTNPSDYTWGPMRGDDGVGINSTLITYAISTSGTTAPTTGWTSSVPSLVNGQYLWTKTVWTYTDNSSKTGYSVTYISKDGSNGDPGKVVSDTEPTTKFKGLTWKYSGSADMTASDGTVILSGTEYYWSGTNWILSEINAHNINGDNLNVTNGKFTDGVIETSWTNGTVSGSTNIQNDHLIITRTDSSANTTNSIGLDSTQGLIMVYTENSTGRTISVGTNFQGMSLTDSTGTSASISPAGVKLSSDVNWTQIGNIGGRRAEWKRENNRVTMNIHGGNGDGFPVVTSGGTLLGILPTNARPPSDISMPATAQGAGATAQISINSTGEVRCYRWGGDSVYFGAYISYYVE